MKRRISIVHFSSSIFYQISKYLVFVLIFSCYNSIDGMDSKLDLYITIEADSNAKKMIFDSYVNGLIDFDTSQPGKYHVTLAQINNVEKIDYNLLQNHFKQIPTTNFTFTVSKVDRYLVGNNRTFDCCPIVIYPNQTETEKFKSFNKQLSEHLGQFKSPSTRKYEFYFDLMPENFSPHITLRNKHQVKSYLNGKSVDECLHAIQDQINNKPFSFQIQFLGKNQ